MEFAAAWRVAELAECEFDGGGDGSCLREGRGLGGFIGEEIDVGRGLRENGGGRGIDPDDVGEIGAGGGECFRGEGGGGIEAAGGTFVRGHGGGAVNYQDHRTFLTGQRGVFRKQQRQQERGGQREEGEGAKGEDEVVLRLLKTGGGGDDFPQEGDVGEAVFRRLRLRDQVHEDRHPGEREEREEGGVLEKDGQGLRNFSPQRRGDRGGARSWGSGNFYWVFHVVFSAILCGLCVSAVKLFVIPGVGPRG